MCNKRNSKSVYLNLDFRKLVRLDNCIADLIVRLNASGIKTIGSCCGHGIYPMTIVALDKFDLPYEFITGKPIPRKRKFYKKDKNGYYYIPECVR